VQLILLMSHELTTDSPGGFSVKSELNMITLCITF